MSAAKWVKGLDSERELLMPRDRTSVLYLLFALLLGSAPIAAAQGGRVVRVPDGVGAEGSCIDPNKDKIWLTLRGLVSSKESGWFTKDTKVGVVIRTTVRAEGLDPITFPLMTEAAFGEGPAGQVALPIEYPLISGLELKQEEGAVTGANVEITLLNLRERTTLGTALATLAEVTSSEKIPIPVTPYTKGASYLLEFANKAVEKDLKAQSTADQAVVGAMVFNFDPSGICGEGFESTGTKAILFSSGEEGPGYISISAINEYCWKATLTPTFVLRAARRNGAVDCSDEAFSGLFRDVTNNYVGLFLNKRSIVRTLGPDSAAERDKTESWKRCIEHGITSQVECPGAGI